MSNVKERIGELLQRHIIVKDSAIGTALTCTRRDILPEMVGIEDVGRVSDVYRASIASGATLLTTNTFLADPLSLQSCGVTFTTEDAVAKSFEAIAEARKGCDRELFVMGSIGPSTRNISLAIDLTEDELRASYRTLIEALHKHSADIFLIESITDIRNAEIAAEVCREVSPTTPIIFSATLSKIGGLLSSGRSVEKFVEDVTKFEPLAIGFNCSHGVKNIVDNIALLVRYTTLPTYVAPSAGLPDAKGRYPETIKKHTDRASGILHKNRAETCGFGRRSFSFLR